MDTKYRIRIGKSQFDEPHYVTKLGDNPSFTALSVNKNPCSWVKQETAIAHCEALKAHYQSAEVEAFTVANAATAGSNFMDEVAATMMALLDSSFLDAATMAQECIEDFEDYDWQPKPCLTDEELKRWDKLMEASTVIYLTTEQLSEVFALADPKGQNHPYYYRVRARELVDLM